MPDAISIRDPFERASPRKTVTIIRWTKNNMRISLADLGSGFKIKGLNEGNNFAEQVNGDSFIIYPGTYLLSNGKTFSKQSLGVIGLNEFVAQPVPGSENAIDNLFGQDFFLRFFSCGF